MRKVVIGLLIFSVLILSVFTGCGAKTESSVSTKQTMVSEVNNDAKANYDTADGNGNRTEQKSSVESPQASGESESITGTGNANLPDTNIILNQRKIIRNANLTIEVENFDIAYGKINTLISPFGFIQESNINKEKIYVDSKQKLITRGVIVIRIDKDKFDHVMNNINSIGQVLHQSTSADDVTEKYFDIESMLRLLRYEQSRLEQYLQKLDDPDAIFKTEERLTKIRHDIERLTGNLRKWDDLIELSTITININEKIPGSDTLIPKSRTYLERLMSNFLDSVKGVVKFCGELIIIFVQVLPVLILLGIFAFIVLFVYRKVSKSKAKEKE